MTSTQPAVKTTAIKPNTQFASDFETTSDPENCRVWCWQVRDIATDEVVAQGTKISEFLEQAPAGRHFFHNSGFDLAFILDALLRTYGYEWVELDNSTRGKAEGRDRLQEGQLTSLIGDQGQHYEVSYRIPGSAGIVVVRDSLRKAPGSLRELGVAYGAEVLKGDTPLHWNLSDDYQPTEDEWAYLNNDTAILAHVLRILFEQGYTSMTIGGDCFRTWKVMLRDRYGREDRGDGKPENAGEVFRRIFPVISQDQTTRLRKAYRGGWTYAKAAFQGRVMKGVGCVYDVNSMYPAVMVQELFPIGAPIELAPGESAPATHPLSITGAVVTFKLRPKHVPCIPNNTDGFGDSGWSIGAEEVELWGTEREWILWGEQYDLQIDKELGGFAFQAVPGARLFGDYITHYMKIKAEAPDDSPQRLLAKLSLNNLWGKFGTDPMRGQRVPTLAGADEPISMPADPPVYDEPVYTPVAIYTTAYARERIVRAAQSNFGRFCYADTDSLHMLGTHVPAGMQVHHSDLGAWKHEGDWSEAIYCRPKAYVERMLKPNPHRLHLDPITGKHNIMVAMAGLPREARDGLAPETVYDGMEFSGKLAKKRVVGGIVLAPVNWKLDYRLGIVEDEPQP